MEFLQVKSPFIGVMCNPTVAIATKYIWNKHGNPHNKITVWHQMMHFPSKIILELSNQYPWIMKTLSRNGTQNTLKAIIQVIVPMEKEF